MKTDEYFTECNLGKINELWKLANSTAGQDPCPAGSDCSCCFQSALLSASVYSHSIYLFHFCNAFIGPETNISKPAITISVPQETPSPLASSKHSSTQPWPCPPPPTNARSSAHHPIPMYSVRLTAVPHSAQKNTLTQYPSPQDFPVKALPNSQVQSLHWEYQTPQL